MEEAARTKLTELFAGDVDAKLECTAHLDKLGEHDLRDIAGATSKEAVQRFFRTKYGGAWVSF